MTSFSRRSFLTTLSMTTAGLALNAQRLPAITLTGTVAPDDMLADPVSPELLRTLATTAMDTAKSAGASYADVRVGSRSSVNTIKQLGPVFRVDLGTSIEFGVRARVGGCWGFVHGVVPTVDAVAEAARGAVALARENSRAVQQQDDFAPPPVATGEWTTPYRIDPFGVPLHEQMSLILGWSNTLNRIPGTGGAFIGIEWVKEIRVIATTSGTLVTQHLLRTFPDIYAGAQYGRGGRPVSMPVPGLEAASAGYEYVANPAVQDKAYETATEVSKIALLPARGFDVGRYPVIFDGYTLGETFYRSVGISLEMDRVLGEEADASGTSFLSPASDFLGQQTFSSLLNVTSDRAFPSVVNVRWDDEGVQPVTTALIKEGRIVDYQTSAEGAIELASWYKQQQQPAGSRGYALSPRAGDPVQIRCGHITITPSSQAATIDDLIRDIPHGLVVLNGLPQTDQQGTSGSMSFWGATFLEVERGKIVARVKDAALQFNTRQLFGTSFAGVGDASTMRDNNAIAFKGQPWRRTTFHTTAPAALLKDVNVIQIGRPV